MPEFRLTLSAYEARALLLYINGVATAEEGKLVRQIYMRLRHAYDHYESINYERVSQND